MENFRPMKINIQDLPKAITAWADEVLIPKSSLIQKGLITFVLLQGQSRFQELLDPLNLLADKDGNFDVDVLYGNLKKSLEAMGGNFTVPVLNYVFDADDLSKMFEIVKRSYAK